MTFLSTKTYGHEIGLSVAFRQWRAKHSHCQYIHGYALSIKMTFEADQLDEKNWVVDFGGLKGLKLALQSQFDHKLVVAEDDPQIDKLWRLHHAGIAQIVVMPAVGCEKFAQLVYGMVDRWLELNQYKPRVKLVEIEVCEHGANSAIYRG